MDDVTSYFTSVIKEPDPVEVYCGMGVTLRKHLTKI